MTTDLREQMQASFGSAYAFERELGGGGLSRVFVATEAALGRKVVIKILPSELTTGVSAERFRQEIQLAAGLQHPLIVPLLQTGEADGLTYYTMPYVEGESLRERLALDQALAVSDSVRILRDVAEALLYAHDVGIVHRDIKPGNVLLSRGHALVTDFGVAKALLHAGRKGTPTSAGMVVGTPTYMAPEQALGDPVDHRADLYSFGVLAYEILTGAPPFRGQSAQDLRAAHLTTAPPSINAARPDVPPALATMVMRCLAKRADDRPQSAQEVLDDLDAVATPAGHLLPEAPPRPKRGWTHRIVAAVAIALVAVAVGVRLFIAPSLRATLTTLLFRDDAKLEPRRIVVAPFDNETGDSSLVMLGDMAADWITQGLLRTGVAEVVDARTAFMTSKVVERTPVLLRPANRALALAEETGAGIVVWGRFYRDADSVRFQTQITDVATGKLMRPVDPVSGDPKSPTDVVERLRERTMAALALAVDTMYGKWSGSFATPPTYEAFQETVRGFESFYRGDSADAFRRLARAASLDTTYMTPVLVRAYASGFYALWPRMDSLTQLAARHFDRLLPSERALLEVLQAGLRGDLTARLRAAWELLRYAAGSAEVPTVAAATATYLNRPREALDALSHTDPDRGLLLVNPTYWVWTTEAYHQLSDFDAELRAAQRARRQFPESKVVMELEVRALAALGRVRDVRSRLDRVSLPPVERAILVARLGVVATRELKAHGHAGAAHELVPDVVEAARALADDASPVHQGARAMMLYDIGHWSDARPIFLELAARDTADIKLQGYLGILAARADDKEEAGRIATKLAQMKRPYLFGATQYWRARIAAVLGQREAAVQLLDSALSAGVRTTIPDHSDLAFLHNYAVHEASDFESLRDYPPFLKLIAPKD